MINRYLRYINVLVESGLVRDLLAFSVYKMEIIFIRTRTLLLIQLIQFQIFLKLFLFSIFTMLEITKLVLSILHFGYMIIASDAFFVWSMPMLLILWEFQKKLETYKPFSIRKTYKFQSIMALQLAYNFFFINLKKFIS